MSRWMDIIDWKTYTALDDQEVEEMLGNLLQS
jgi:hypothetical protein